jgi:hypothetical protein
MLIEIEHGDEVCVLRLTGQFRSGEGWITCAIRRMRSGATTAT